MLRSRPLLINLFWNRLILTSMDLQSQRDGEVNWTVDEKVEQDLRVDLLVSDLFQLFNVEDYFAHRHVVKPLFSLVLFPLCLFLLLELLKHKFDVILLCCLHDIQVLYLTLCVTDPVL